MKEIAVKETPASIYLMHKYWGKKPSKELKEILNKYTKKEDIVLDPFAGYGGIGVEGTLMNRNVILNDLNPMANFISNTILCTDVNMELANEYFLKLKTEYKEMENKWYTFKNEKIISILRDKSDNLIKLKLCNNKTKKMYIYDLKDDEIKKMLQEENDYKIINWYPDNFLIKNSRLSAKDNMKVSDLFSKRELICQSYLYKLIDELPKSIEKDLFKLAFTSNLANCSKLVPPITSRGEMSQGAWMTGFYIGERYLENNVFHYFENRVNKIIKGKKDFFTLLKNKRNVGKYKILNNDAKNLNVDDESIDFIFTDFPYGDTVPYFEQSQIWNSWLKHNVDYENEIVISNSNERKKNDENFAKDIQKAIKEISRVLKNKAYFVFTFHSLSGNEWEAIANALLENNFEFVDCQMMLQKTFTPRQLNRKITVKGDLLVVYRKNTKNKKIYLNLENMNKIIEEEIKRNFEKEKKYDTNEIITLCVKCLLKNSCVNNNIDFVEIIKNNFIIDEENDKKWRRKNEIR